MFSFGRDPSPDRRRRILADPARSGRGREQGLETQLQHKSFFIRPGTGHPTAESLHAAAALGNSLVFLCPRRARTFGGSYDELEARLRNAGAGLYMLVDGSTGAGLLADLAAAGAELTPLFPGNTDEELLDTAPRLVRCRDHQTVLHNFHRFWARGIASMLISPAAPEALAQHLKRNLYIEDPDGELCILRFHDPRVLGRLNQTLFDDQMAHFFGDVIDSYLFEGPAGEVRQWSRNGEVQT